MTGVWVLILYMTSGLGNSSTATSTSVGYFESKQQCEQALLAADTTLSYTVEGVCVQGVHP